MQIIVADTKIPENSWRGSGEHLFPVLREIGDTYGNDFVVENWDALLNYQAVSHELRAGHRVTVQILRD